MVSVLEEIVNEAVGKGNDVPDGLHPGVRLSDLPVRGHLGPKSQLQPFHGFGEPEWSLTDGTLYLPREQEIHIPLSARTSDKDVGR